MTNGFWMGKGVIISSACLENKVKCVDKLILKDFGVVIAVTPKAIIDYGMKISVRSAAAGKAFGPALTAK